MSSPDRRTESNITDCYPGNIRIKFRDEYNRPFIFQDDNATPNSSRQTNIWKTENGISKFNWPAQSSDLNIIENIWRCIKIKLSREIDTIENRSDLVNAVTRIWNGLSQTYIRSLYASIPARIRQVMIQKGYATK